LINLQTIRTCAFSLALAVVATITIGMSQSKAADLPPGWEYSHRASSYRHVHRLHYRHYARAHRYHRARRYARRGHSNGAGGTMIASWYGGGEKLASHTASGQPFRAGGRTVAHRSLPFGTRLLISYGGRSTVCVVNDRGPAAWTGRSIDLARGCAQAIGMRGVSPVHVARI
jgi:rare lipoprotein A